MTPIAIVSAYLHDNMTRLNLPPVTVDGRDYLPTVTWASEADFYEYKRFGVVVPAVDGLWAIGGPFPHGFHVEIGLELVVTRPTGETS